MKWKEKMDSIEKKLSEIDNAYRGLPFWSWNGKLDKKEVLRQIHIMKEMGFGGFFIHSRTGLATEYLGQEWMDLIRSCAAEGEKLNMQVFLYDEDRWPSGSAGGMATVEPKYRMKFMSLTEEGKRPPESEPSKQIESYAIKFNQDGTLNDYYILKGKDISLGYTKYILSVEEMKCDPVYNGYTYLDTLSGEATQKFIDCTHELYKRAMGEMFGKQIVGIFTDEPHRGCTFGGFGMKNANGGELTPFTEKLFDCFKKICGYSLMSRLPELFFENTNSFSKVSYDYVKVIQQMFLDNFAKPYHDWCVSNKLIVTGHVLHEDALSYQTAMAGSIMRYYEYMDYPGVDILTESNKSYWVAKQVSSVAKQLGQPFVLSELYGCTGWQFNFENHKNVGDWQAIMGINMRCHHLSWYTMKGEAKRDYPASIFYQSAWWKSYGYIEEYFSRMGKALSLGEPVTNVLVIHPVESVWGYVRKNAFSGLIPNLKEIQTLEESFVKEFQSLTNSGIDFDYADEDMFSRIAFLNKSFLQVGKMRYKTVIISADTVRSSTLKLLNDFIKSGGRVIVNKKPFCVDGEICEIDYSGYILANNAQNVAEICCKSDCLISVNTNDILFQTRKVGEEYLAVFINTLLSEDKRIVSVSINALLNVYEYDLRKGKKVPCKFKNIDGKTVAEISFAKGQERMLVFTKNIVPQTVINNDIFTPVNYDKSLKYKLSEPNILVLDRPICYINSVCIGKDEILRQDRKIRDIFSYRYRGGEELQPWYKEKIKAMQVSKAKHPIRLAYEFESNIIPNKISFVTETPQIYTVKLNGKTVESFTDETFIDNSFFVAPLDVQNIVIGKNILELCCDFDADTDLEACYLIGDFGVSLNNDANCCLCKLPEKLHEGSLQEQFLPFYSGLITFNTGIFGTDSSCAYKAEFKEINGAYIQMDFGNKQEMMCFAPYETESNNLNGECKFTLCLTRRNTFGPLHIYPAKQWACDPNSFHTTGEAYKDEYVFYNEKITFPHLFKI